MFKNNKKVSRLLKKRTNQRKRSKTQQKIVGRKVTIGPKAMLKKQLVWDSDFAVHLKCFDFLKLSMNVTHRLFFLSPEKKKVFYTQLHNFLI